MNGQRLRPLGLGDIFDEGFDLYKRNFVFLLLVTAIAVVPLDIGLAFAGPPLFSTVFDLFGVTANSDASGIWLVVFATKLTLFLPLFLLAVAPLVAASAGRYLEQDVTVWPVYRAWLRRLPGLLLALVLAGAALALGLLFCGVIWLVPAVLFFFTLHAFAVEGKGPGKALGRSRGLVAGYGGRVVGCLFLLALIAWVIGLGVTFPLAYLVQNVLHLAPGAQSLYGGVSGTERSGEQQIVTLITQGLAHLVLIPFLACVVTVLYYDLRIRKEGFDIELLADELHYPPLVALGPFLPPAAVYGPARPAVPMPARPPGSGSGGPPR
jgi:hypothetical protein